MNVFKILMAVSLCILVVSCAKENVELQQETSKVFSKTVDLSDAEGNTTKVKISAAEEHLLSNLDASALQIVTTKEVFENTDVTSFTNVEVEEYLEDENEIFIDIVQSKMNSDVTGFRVEVKNELTQRALWNYGYGANGVRGVSVTLVAESRPVCNLTAKFYKRNASQSSYSLLAKNKLRDVGETFSYRRNTSYFKYRLKRYTGGLGCGSTTSSFFWLN